MKSKFFKNPIFSIILFTMQETSLLDLIYHYLIAFDNDSDIVEKRQLIIEKLKGYTKGKVPVYHFILNCIDNIRCRNIIKEIGDLIMLNIEEDNIFLDDYVLSKEKANYYNCIYLPSLHNQCQQT